MKYLKERDLPKIYDLRQLFYSSIFKATLTNCKQNVGEKKLQKILETLEKDCWSLDCWYRYFGMKRAKFQSLIQKINCCVGRLAGEEMKETGGG